MSYASYSEVYFAISTVIDNYFKIGETTNSSRRGSQLEKDGFRIIMALDVPEDYAERLFVESYLRARISATGKACRIRTDYFQADDANTVDWMAKHFNTWVKEAVRLLNQMQNDEVTNGSPVAPAGYEAFFNTILQSIYVDGYWQENLQMTTDIARQRFEMLKKAFEPFGYRCTTRRNYSWVYTKIEKI